MKISSSWQLQHSEKLHIQKHENDTLVAIEIHVFIETQSGQHEHGRTHNSTVFQKLNSIPLGYLNQLVK